MHLYTYLSYIFILISGTEVLIDGLERSGSLIIGPSFVERRLRVKTKSSVSAHNLEVYRAGLVAIIDDAMYTKRMRSRMSRVNERGSELSLTSTALTAPPLPLLHLEEGEKEVEEGIGDTYLLPTVSNTHTHERERTNGASVSDGYEDGVAHYIDHNVASTTPTAGARAYLYSSLIDLSGDDLAQHIPTSHGSSSSSSSPPATYSPIITDTSDEDKTVGS